MAFISGALSILLRPVLLPRPDAVDPPARPVDRHRLAVPGHHPGPLAAASDPTVPARGWQIFLGIVSSLAGIVLIVSPFASIAVLTLVGGCWLLAVGVTEIVTAFVIRGRAKHIPAVV